VGKLSFILYYVFTLHKFFQTLTVILLFFLFGAIVQELHAEESLDSTSCCQCHDNILETDLSKTNVHPPFLNKQCLVCHLDDSEKAVAELQVTPTNNISWLGANYSLAIKHWFNIPVDLVSSDELLVVASDYWGNSHKEILPLPKIEMMQEKTFDSTPYIITPEVARVYRRLFITAKINWSTKEESDSEIRYGIEKLIFSVKSDEFTTDHEIVLQNLKSNQTYKYVVLSRDIVGNKVESEIAFFLTENLSPVSQPEYENYTKVDTFLSAKFYQNGDSYLLEIVANQPVTIKVGTKAIKENVEKSFETNIANNPNHPPLRNRDELSTSVCKICHENIFHAVSHPINVSPLPGMTISKDYKINSSGNITCITCHASHASNFEYITVKSSSLELCLGCHEGYYLSPNGSPRIIMAGK
jgi:predicted CXXCH cytochrome family protein